MLSLRPYFAAFTLGLLVSQGCGSGEGEGCVGHCEPGQQAVWCWTGIQKQSICGPDQNTAALSCDAGGGSWAPAVVCKESDDEGTSSTTGYPHSLDPARHVYFDESDEEYVIDREAFEELSRDPSPLADDATTLRLLESGYYRVVAPGALSDALGWKPGDILLSVDGRDLGGLGAFVDAYSELASNTTFTLTLDRGGQAVILSYRVE